MNNITNWNKIDSVILFCENQINRLKETIIDSLDSEPDSETVIMAETAYLREENERMKRREMPVYLIEYEGRYFCPKCQATVPDTAKYCSNCGHRVTKHIPLHFSLGNSDQAKRYEENSGWNLRS